MRLNRFIFPIPLLILLSACTDSLTGAYSEAVPLSQETMVEQKSNNPNLAYDHRFEIELPREDVNKRFKATIEYCNQQVEHACTITGSSINRGESYVAAEMGVRIKGEGVDQLIKMASEGGVVRSQHTSAEDLSESIADHEKRLKMLLSYEGKLKKLESRTGHDVDSLIKIASELSQVQSDIEQAQGGGESLRKRVLLDLVTIRFSSIYESSFWGEIGDAFEEFGDNLSEGTANAILAVAYLIPWLVVISAFFFLFRWLRNLIRKRRADVEND